MKTSTLLLLVTFSVLGCGKSSTAEHEENSSDSTSSTQALYDQVMDIHNEVMPKTEDIYRLKKKLQDQIASTPELVVEEKQKLQKRIANLDSVSHLMDDWMHRFSPLPDTASQEAAREYLESEMEKIRIVRGAILEIIAREKGFVPG